MKVVLLGDIHGRWKRVHAILNHELGTRDGFAMSTGDLCTYALDPAQLQRSIDLYFIGGNHESFKAIDEISRDAESHLKPIMPGKAYDVNGFRFAGLSGIYSEHLYNKPDKRFPISRYFSHEDIANLKDIEGPVDFFLAHQAPKHAGILFEGKDAGVTPVNEVIDHLDPHHVFLGHYHLPRITRYGNISVISLGHVHHRYGVFDTDTDSLQMHHATLQKGGYRYDWE